MAKNGNASGIGLTKILFGSYEMDLKSAELRKGGSLLKLKPQPFKVLAHLAENAGEVVTREELRERIWGQDTFVDFERGLNSCITQIRAVLNDSAESPRYVETLPRRGYRFICAVERVNGVPATAAGQQSRPSAAGSVAAEAVLKLPPPSRRQVALLIAGLLAATLLVTWLLKPGIVKRLFDFAGPPLPAQRIMLAVLPFQNLSGDPQQEAFGDGMTEEMIAVLGGLQPGRLGVIARTSAMRYKTAGKSVREIGQELGVAFVLEGSVRRDGGRVRITAQLIRVSDETHVWAENYERPTSDVLGVQRDVALQVARALAIELLPSAARTLAEKTAANPAAYEAYLLGRFRLNQMNGRGFLEAVRHFEKATALDPRYAIAYTGLADAYNLQPWWGMSPPKVALEKGRAAALKALELDPQLADAHNSLAFVQLYYDWDLPAAERSFRRAIELQPGFALAHYWFAGMLSAAGRHDEAIASIRRAQQLDPYSEMVNSDAGWYFYFARRYDEAAAQCKRALEMKPGFAWAALCVFEAQLAAGKLADAVETNKSLMRMGGFPPEIVEEMKGATPAETLNRMRHAWLERGRNRSSSPAGNPPAYGSSFPAVAAFAALGEPEKAVEILEQVIAARDSAVINLKVDPRMDPLRNHPRFQELLRRTGI